MKRFSLIILISLLSLGVFCQDSKTEKIEALMGLFMAEASINNRMDNLISEVLKTADANDSLFWAEYRVRVENTFYDSVVSQAIALYDKYFTEEELEFLHQFYTSVERTETLIKMQELQLELFLIGYTYGEVMSEQIFQDIQKKEEEDLANKMNYEYEGCERFRTGKFNYTVMDTFVFSCERTENQQIETFRKGRAVYDIEWLDDCKYVLTTVESNDPYELNTIGSTLTVNIYECEEESYKYVSKNENDEFIFEGEMIKIE